MIIMVAVAETIGDTYSTSSDLESKPFNAAVLKVGGAPNGLYPVRGNGPYCPMGQIVESIRRCHGAVHDCFLNWLKDFPREGLLGSHVQHVPGYALKAIFESYQNDPKMRAHIIGGTKEEILAARERSGVLYLVGHSLGAAIICEALKELIGEGRINRNERERLYLMLLAPAIGPVMGGFMKPNLTPYELADVVSGVNGVAEFRVINDPFSAPTPWGFNNAEDCLRVAPHKISPPFTVQDGSLHSVVAGAIGHTMVGKWAAPQTAEQVSAWAGEASNNLNFPPNQQIT